VPCLLLGLGASVARADTADGELVAHRLAGVIQLDGRLDEDDWRAATAAGHFTQDAPHHGEAATSDTEVRVLYDDQYLYVGARLHHPGHVTGLVHRRDRDSASDWFGVAIDSVHDRRTAHEFRVNAAGVQRDVLLYADTSSDDTWDAVWDSSVTVDADGWSAELRIPLSVLRIRAARSSRTSPSTASWPPRSRSTTAGSTRAPGSTPTSGSARRPRST